MIQNINKKVIVMALLVSLFGLEVNIRAEDANAFVPLKEIATKAEFFKVRENGQNQLFIFTAKWCPPCQEMKLLLKSIAREYKGKVQFFILDIDNQALKELFDTYDIQALPTLMFMDQCSQLFFKHVGFLEKKALKKTLDQLTVYECRDTSDQKKNYKKPKNS